tara:strand:- start:1012 stop:1227 length:216 start_codon:yes stop_codon:yes gene_type:complete
MMTYGQYVIYRNPEGISLNGKEYVLDDDGEPITFTSEKHAIEFLHGEGIDESLTYEGDIYEEYGIGIERIK